MHHPHPLPQCPPCSILEQALLCPQEVLHARQLAVAAELSALSEEEARRARASAERWQVG